MLNKSFFIALSFLFATAISAQTTYKYGHMNLGNLVEQLPDVAVATASLKVFADKFASVDDSLNKTFEADAKKFQADYQAGLLPPIAAQKAQEELEKRQQFIEAFQKNANDQLNAKRQEMLAPILKKVQDAVTLVAKENGYAIVFDTSSGIALYALETEDVTSLVKKKLGL